MNSLECKSNKNITEFFLIEIDRLVFMFTWRCKGRKITEVERHSNFKAYYKE
jgi:hypothetical protein